MEHELFQVISGGLRLEFIHDTDVILNPGEFCVVPRGVLHNPVADEVCEIVLVRNNSIKTHRRCNYVSHQVNRGKRCAKPS
jgi:quercetin dioxygenase-like cupin family protein